MDGEHAGTDSVPDLVPILAVVLIRDPIVAVDLVWDLDLAQALVLAQRY